MIRNDKFALTLNSGSENVTRTSQLVNLSPTVIKLVELLLSVLMNGAEVYASRMMLLLTPVSASALSRCPSWLTIRLVSHYQPSGWWLREMILLELKVLIEVKNYRVYS
jgi:hypothetical protein